MTIDQLKESGFRFQKRYGQNFITDTNLLRAIVADAGVGKEDDVIEVGAGAGTLTRALCEKAKFVTAYEIDKELAPILDALQREFDNLKIIYGDVLKQDAQKCTMPEESEQSPLSRTFHLVANLPYYITTPVIFHFLNCPGLCSLTVMVQKEVAERFTAKAGSAEYGAVTAQLAAYGTPVVTRIVPRKLFVPSPNVDSAVVHLKIEKKQGITDFALLRKLIAAAFAMRRKTLVNNLTAGFSLSRELAERALEIASLPSGIRGETLGIEEFIRLSNVLAEQKVK